MMDMVAVMVVKGWRNGMIIILMCFEGRATGFMKGLNGNFVSLFCIFFGLRPWKDGLAIGGRLKDDLVWGRKLRSSLFDALGLR